jgi:hypothetical protein
MAFGVYLITQATNSFTTNRYRSNMLGFKVQVQNGDKKAELEIHGFADQESADSFADDVQDTLEVVKAENGEITSFEVERPGLMDPLEDAPEADIEDFIDQITMSVMSAPPETLVSGGSPLRFSVV